jgi:molecular chaperone DnaJ
VDRDYYNVLGVNRAADADEVKRAYRTLALRWHPDRNPGDAIAEQRFKDINEAYRVLSDAELRARYDRLGPLFTEDGRPPRPDEVSDVVTRVWDNLWGRKRKTRGEDLRYTLSVTLEQVATGAQREVVVPRLIRCVTCNGVGAPSSQREPCKACAGTGKTTGNRLLRTTCFHCKGRGFTVLAPCNDCRGDGRITLEEALRVKVPPGVATGQKLKLAGKGNDSADGTPGDLLVLIDVADHAWFRRRGDDLVVTVPITFGEATLGGDIAVPTLTGRTTIRVAPGTTHGRVLRLAGRGLPSPAGTGTGDMHIEVAVEIPTGLSEAERARLMAWFDALPASRQPRREAFQLALSQSAPKER